MPEDTNRRILGPSQSNSSSTPVTGKPSLSASREKIIQPTESILKEVQNQQVEAPKTNMPVVMPTTSEAPQGQAVPPADAGQMPIGVSASSLGLNNPQKSGINRGRLIKRVIIVAVLLILAAAAGLYAKTTLFSSLKTVQLSNDGYTYTYKYYRKDTQEVQLSNGRSAYKYDDSSTSGATTTTVPLVSDCSQIGSSWKQAFTVKVNGDEEPVCNASSGDLQDYMLVFSAFNKHHLFAVTYRNADQLSSDTSTLKTIFSSVKVSQ